MIKEFLEVGQIVGTHGVRGEMRVNPWADGPEFIKQFKTLYYDNRGEKSVRVVSARPHGNVAIVKLEGIDTVEKASAMRNKIIFMKRSDAKIAKNSYFISELIGCEVYDAENADVRYGTLTDVSETGANDVWHITKDSKEYLIPAIPSVVINVDVAANRVEIKPLRGIFDDEN